MAPPTSPDPAAAIAAVAARCDHRVTRDGAQGVHWRLMGDGRPLVLLHGGYGSWLHWLTVIEALAERWRVACPDMPGFAESGGREPPYDPPRIAAALADGIDELFGRETPVAVAGFSFGGLVAGHLARALGPRAAYLCLIGSGGLGSDRPLLGMRSRGRGMSDEEVRAVHRHNLTVLMLKEPARVDDLAVEIQRRNTDRRPTITTATFSRTAALEDVLPAVSCPVHAVWGDGDATVGPFLDRRLATLRRAAPHARVTMIPDCGHWAMYEQPAAVAAVFPGG